MFIFNIKAKNNIQMLQKEFQIKLFVLIKDTKGGHNKEIIMLNIKTVNTIASEN